MHTIFNTEVLFCFAEVDGEEGVIDQLEAFLLSRHSSPSLTKGGQDQAEKAELSRGLKQHQQYEQLKQSVSARLANDTSADGATNKQASKLGKVCVKY